MLGVIVCSVFLNCWSEVLSRVWERDKSASRRLSSEASSERTMMADELYRAKGTELKQEERLEQGKPTITRNRG